MADPDTERPDPDALLRKLHAEEARTARAKLKIFFGFAPGVGKTYRMLQVARDLAEHGRDVLVGIVETHKRVETAALVDRMNVLPRRRIEHRNFELEEFDLDAALARRPQLILVDELAHSNPEGSRHPKRWQDVMDLLDAGIDVFTTVNVQHIESLNDVIAQITHVHVRETVPDTVLERADEIELVDISPEQLLERLREGKVYLPEQAERAASHFFQRGNLLALRELALRQAAQHVESDVLEYRAEHGVDTTWATTERVLVSVGPAPASAQLVRAAKRIAAGLQAPWVAAYVEAAGRKPLGTADHTSLEANLRLAESLGATVVRLSGVDVATPLLTYARKHNVTRLLIGKPTHARFYDRLRGSLLDSVVRSSGSIDVHVISGDAEQPASGRRREVAPAAPEAGTPAQYLIAALLVAATTGVGLGIHALYPMPDLQMLYLLAVIVTAWRLGRGPSILSAALSVAGYDFFFVPPYLTFAVRDIRYALSFVMMFGIGFALSALTTRIRRQELEAIAREERAAALLQLSRDLGSLLDARQVAAVVAQHAADAFEASAAILLPAIDRSLQALACFPAGTAPEGSDLGVAKWTFEHGRLAGLGTDTLPGARCVCAELRAGPTTVGVLSLTPRSGKPLTSDQHTFLEALCRQAAFGLERARLSEEARAAALRAKTEELRSSLLSAVSHDLRTPLAVITGTTGVLRDGSNMSEAERTELLDTIGDEAERLEHLVTNLLDMTRLATGGMEPKRDWVPLEEIVGSALTRLETKLGSRPITTRLPADLPLLSVDPLLFHQVFVNLLENARKYTPADSPLEITAHVTPEGKVEILFCDRGPGIPEQDLARVFEKFQRGSHVGIGGVGLGLPICRGIVEAHGGTLRVENRKGGGACFRIELPNAGPPPREPSAHD